MSPNQGWVTNANFISFSDKYQKAHIATETLLGIFIQLEWYKITLI